MTRREGTMTALKELGFPDEVIEQGFRDADGESGIADSYEQLRAGTERDYIVSIKVRYAMFATMSPEQQKQYLKESKQAHLQRGSEN